jgi:3-methyladenine DNA glycosylase AlkD
MRSKTRASTPASTSHEAALAEAALHALAHPGKAATAAAYFKTGPGEYGEGDRFYGIRVPQVREVARQFNTLPLPACVALLQSPYNEARLMALAILVRRFEKGDVATQEAVYQTYMAQRHRVNNWNLVDSSAPYVAGPYLLHRDRSVLHTLAQSGTLWDRRIAVLATFAFIRANDYADTLALCESLLADPHDLMHKACGWMLREVGKRDEAALLAFLQKHHHAMPRTMLRYAIEKLEETEREAWLKS